MYIHASIHSYIVSIEGFGSWALLGHSWRMGFLARRYETVIGAPNFVKNMCIHYVSIPVSIYS